MSKKKIIASSILSLAMCASVITGATFALFTDELTNKVVISSGKVDVTATITELDVYSPESIYENGDIAVATDASTMNADGKSGVFVNGGTASLDTESAVLTLTNMTPGDKVTFNIVIENNSNVAAMYRTLAYTEADDGIVEVLDIKLGANDFDGSNLYSNWAALSLNENERTITVACSVELPTSAGNVYQDKACSIGFNVKAVQGNTKVTDAVATVGDAEFATIQEAIDKAEAGEIVQIIRPGTYAPFVVNKDNVTIKGINTGVKATSTIIKNTATSNIQVKSDNVVLDNLYIDSSVKTQIDWLNSGAVSLYESSNAGWPVENVTIKNCYIVSNSNDNAIIYNGKNINFIDNVVENAAIALYYSASEGENHVVTGNTFKNIGAEAIIYNPEGGNGSLALTIKNNAFVGAKTQFSISDYVNTAYKNIEIKNNTGNVVYVLNMFNMKDVETPYDVVPLPGQELVSMTSVAFSGITFADYTIKNADGTEMFHWNETTPSTETWLANGDYILKNNKTGIKYLFSVTEPQVGVQQLVKLDTVGLETVEDMFAFANDVNNNNNKYEGVTVQLLNDIDLENKAWTPIGQTGATQFNGTFDGNNHTIRNLNVDTTPLGRVNQAAAGIFGWLEIYATSSIKNLKVENVTVKSGKTAGAIVGYMSGEGTIQNCEVTNATISGTRAAAFVGQMNTENALVNCDVNTATITGSESLGAICGYTNGTVDAACSATNVNLIVSGQEAMEFVLENTPANGSVELNMAAGTYKLYGTAIDREYSVSSLLTNKTVTFVGTKAAVFDINAWREVTTTGATIKFDGVTIKGYNDTNKDNWHTEQFKDATKVTYNDCTIEDLITAYASSDFIGCTFDNDLDNQYSVYCYSNGTFNFTGCTFNTLCGKAIKIFDEGQYGEKIVNIADCKFIATNESKKAAIEIDGINRIDKYKVTISNYTINDKYSDLYADKNSFATVTVTPNA